MKAITSRDNPQYKELKQFAIDQRARKKAVRTLLDGIHLCQVYLQQVGAPLVCVANETAIQKPEVAAIVDHCMSLGARCIFLPDVLYKPLSQVESGIGILFLIAIPQAEAPARLTQSAVLLDQIQDPGNLGSILRSAAAAGISQVFCSAGTSAAWSPRVLRAGMGAHFLLQIVENADFLSLLESADIPVLATSSYAEQSIYDIDLRQPAAWLFGHEGQGVSANLLNLATHSVSIPHRGAMESLNVAASAAVCFFEQVRQMQS